MNKKPFYESKTMLFNIFSLALVAIQVVTQQNLFNIDPEILALVISFINIGLRITSGNKTLTIKK